MRAINHAVTGAIIGLVVTNPVAAVAGAFMSHFALDAMPHHDDVRMHRPNLFNAILGADALLCMLLVLALYILRSDNWFVPSLAAFAATSPDFMWMRSWLNGIDTKKELNNWFLRFHSKIQWSQTPRGIYMEILWFMAGMAILLKLLQKT